MGAWPFPGTMGGNPMRNFGMLIAATAATTLGAGSANAAALDYTALTGAIDAQTIALAILSVGGLMVVPRLARMGVNWIKGSVK